MSKLIKLQIPNEVEPILASDGQGGYFMDLTYVGTGTPPVIIPPIIVPPQGGALPEYNLPWPSNGQWQIPTDPNQAKELPILSAALQNWSDGYINWTVPVDLPKFDNKTKFGQFRIVPGLWGNLPSGSLTVDGGALLPFSSEFPDWGYSVDNPGTQAFNVTRGSVVRLRLVGAGSFVLVMSTPTRT